MGEKGVRKEGKMQGKCMETGFCPVPPTESGSAGASVALTMKQILQALVQPAFFQTLEKRSTVQKTRKKETQVWVEEDLIRRVRDYQSVCS